MPTADRTPTQLQRENHEELRAQLAEAHELLRAIREGDVDALVVSTPEGRRVFTLQSTDQTYRTIIEQMQEGAVTLVESGRISYSNRRFAEMVKRPLEQIFGLPFGEFVAAPERDRFDLLIQRARQGNARGELTFQAADGTLVPAQLAMNSTGLDGAPAICVVVTDLTERRRAEALLHNEQFVRRLIDNASIGIAVVDRDLRFALANPAYEATAGGPVVGRAIAEVFPPAVAEIVQPLVRQVFVSGEAADFREYEVPVFGRSWWNVSLVPLRDAAGSTEAVLILAQDVTRHKRAEEALRSSERSLAMELDAAQRLHEVSTQLIQADDIEALYEQILDTAMAILHSDFASLQMLHPERGTGGALRLLGYRGFSPEAAAFWHWVTPASESTCGEALRTGQRIFIADVHACDFLVGTNDLEMYLQTGIRAVQTTPLFSRSGALLGMISTHWREPHEPTASELRALDVLARQAADLIDRKRSEDALVHAKAAAEAANQAKSRFLANMSHELRTPMNAILGMIDVALPKAADPTVQDCLETAKGSADLLLTLLNDLLDSAKIEAGKLELESAPFSLRAMLDQISRVLSVRASERGLCFSCHVSNETPDAVVGDRTRLQQVLLNLAGNAIKFTEQGEVEVRVDSRASRVENPALDSELSTLDSVVLEFAVRDTGIGIPTAVLEQLFRPFAQADPSTARRFGGTGLGLVISKNLVEMMGGTIGVESEVGSGSTFTFTVRLPLAKELPAESGAAVALPATAPRALRILLAEDNPANQKLATYILQDRGHTVEIAGNGREALLLAEQNRYDVILMDVQMPMMNGLDATAAIRKRESEKKAGGRVPIIAMTAHAMQGDREQCLAAGMDGYLSKPIQSRELLAVVEGLAPGAPPAAEPEPRDPVSSPTTAVFNPEEAITRCYKSEKMLRDMIQCFFDEVEALFPQMRAALGQRDLEEVGRLGHRMKGTVVYLGAELAKEAADGVERFCKEGGGTVSEAEEAINALERACEVLKRELAGHPLTGDITTIP